MNLNYYSNWTKHSLLSLVDCNWTDCWLSGRSQKSGSFFLVSSPYSFSFGLRGVGIWFLFIPSFLPLACIRPYACNLVFAVGELVSTSPSLSVKRKSVRNINSFIWSSVSCVICCTITPVFLIYVYLGCWLARSGSFIQCIFRWVYPLVYLLVWSDGVQAFTPTIHYFLAI